MANAMLDAEPMWLSRRSVNALDDAVTTIAGNFERTLAVLREENSTLRRMLEAEGARANQLLLELTKAAVLSAATSVAGPAAAHVGSPPPRRTSKDPVPGVGNLLDPVPFGDKAGLFDTEAAASLMAAEDDDGISAAA